MFKIAEEPTFTHDVTARVPVDGGHKDETFKATFRVLEPERLDGFDLATTEGATAFLKAAIKKLDDVTDAEGKPLPWSDEVLNQVLRLPYARVALTKSYFEAVHGAPAGN